MVGCIKVLLTGKRDEQTNSLVSSLSSVGMNVRVCRKNGVEVLGCIEELNPDVLIMDAFMEHIDALGVLSRMNMMNPVDRPLILVRSCIDNSSFQKTFFEAGADYCVLQPIEPQLVAERIVQMVSWKGVGVFANSQCSQELEIAISEILHKIGIPVKLKGYRYLREAIRLVVENPEMINYVTSALYPHIAETFNSEPTSVERAMRYAIGYAWKNGNVVLFKSYFGSAVKNPRKPSNSEFVLRISDDLRFKRKMHLQLDGPYACVKSF